jgi:GNAT superfamily N-acetyltransferase
MSFTSLFFAEEKTHDNKDREELLQDLDDLEFQMFRMKENMRKIAKKWQIIGIDQTKDDTWVVVYTNYDNNSVKIMLNDCESSYRGMWDFSIQATYQNDETIFIGDIKGPENKGYGSICMNYLKEVAKEQNIQYITGDIAKRDWDHVERLVHFYEKHRFQVKINEEHKSGEIVWQPYN